MEAEGKTRSSGGDFSPGIILGMSLDSPESCYCCKMEMFVLSSEASSETS